MSDIEVFTIDDDFDPLAELSIDEEEVAQETDYLPPIPDAELSVVPPKVELPPAERIAKLIEGIPGQMVRILRTVELCREPRTMSELAAEVDAEFPNEVSVYTAAQLVQLLERAGGVERVEDEAPADAGEPLVDADGFMVVTPAPPVRYVATTAGLDAAEARVSEAAIIAMLQEEPQYLPLYERIFSMCSREGGCPVKELDAAIDHDPLCVEPRRFCGYFLGKLERLGALEWNTVWTVSALGTQVMASDIFSRN